MTLKSDAKFKGKLTRGLKIDIRNLVNVHANSRKSDNFQLDGVLLSVANNVSEVRISKNGMRNLVNFNASNGKSENLRFDVLLLLKVYYV